MDPNLIGARMLPGTLPRLLDKPKKAVVVLDASGSCVPGPKNCEKDALTLVSQLEAQGTQVGVVRFSNSVEVLRSARPGPAAGEVSRAFQAREGAGGLGAAVAIETAGLMVGGGPGLVLVLTDGTLDPEVRSTVDHLGRQGVRVVGVGSEHDNPRVLSSLFAEHYLIASGPGQSSPVPRHSIGEQPG